MVDCILICRLGRRTAVTKRLALGLGGSDDRLFVLFFFNASGLLPPQREGGGGGGRPFRFLREIMMRVLLHKQHRIKLQL